MNKGIGLVVTVMAAAAVMAGGTAYGAVSSSSIPGQPDHRDLRERRERQGRPARLPQVRLAST